MKNIQMFVKSFVACAGALAMISTLAAQTPEQVTAKVIRIKGPARYSTGNNIWQPLKVGTVLNAGTVIQTSTDKGAYVDVVLGLVDPKAPAPAAYNPNAAASTKQGGAGVEPMATQNLVRLYENTVLSVDKITSLNTGADVVSETQLDLRAGHILGTVKKMSAASHYEVKLPNGVAAIRGTTFDIVLTSTGTGTATFAGVTVTVTSGSVVFSFQKPNGEMQTIVVDRNQQGSNTGVVLPLTLDQAKAYNDAANQFLNNNPNAPFAPPLLVPTQDHTVISTSPSGQ